MGRLLYSFKKAGKNLHIALVSDLEDNINDQESLKMMLKVFKIVVKYCKQIALWPMFITLHFIGYISFILVHFSFFLLFSSFLLL